MAVKNSVRDIRKQHREAQKELALAIGVDSKTIRNIEQTVTCSFEVALRLSTYYEITVNNIFRLQTEFNQLD